MAGKFLRTLLLMFISSSYLIYNARRDTESICYCNTDDTGASSSSGIQKKKADEKNNFEQRHVNVTRRANSSRRMT